jgi:hypothetical protein
LHSFFHDIKQTLHTHTKKTKNIELGQYGHINPKYFDALQDIVALIAYTDPFTSPVADYLSQERREEIASNLNSYILGKVYNS